MSAPAQERATAPERLTVAAHICGRHETTFSIPTLVERMALLPQQHRELLERAQRALAGDATVPVIKAETNEQGGHLEFAQILHGAQHVEFRRDRAGRGTELAVLDAQREPLARVQDLEPDSPPQAALSTPQRQAAPEGARRTSLVQTGIEHSVATGLACAGVKRTFSSAGLEEGDPSRREITRIDLKREAIQRAQGLPGGVGAVEIKLAEKTLQLHGANGRPLPGAIVASQARDGSWVRNGNADDRLDGAFIFVRLLDGTLRVGNAVNGQNAHFQLAGRALQVMYAGRVEFAAGKVIRYDNQSGTYVPPGELSHQAGFAGGIFDDEASKSSA
ncbi:hypothetical protein [Phytopseudomonas flavescens]|nr:hypothetical protein [Pseudomonas flavescens]